MKDKASWAAVQIRAEHVRSNLLAAFQERGAAVNGIKRQKLEAIGLRSGARSAAAVRTAIRTLVRQGHLVRKMADDSPYQLRDVPPALRSNGQRT